MSESTTPEATAGTGADEGTQEGKTFTQAEVDRIVGERVKRTQAQFADYDDLKAKAGEKASADDRIAALETEVQTTKREALRRTVQARHGISDEDADLFLTGADEDALNKQAERLAARDSGRKPKPNHVPREGENPQPPADENAAFVGNLFGSS